jgi:cyanuric acid amidohydrolase
MFSAFLQDNLIYISGSATHQGPPGGGTLAVVVDAE